MGKVELRKTVEKKLKKKVKKEKEGRGERRKITTRRVVP